MKILWSKIRRTGLWAALPAIPLAALLAWLFFAPCRAPLEGVSFSGVILDNTGAPLRVSLSRDQKYRIHTRLTDIPRAAVEAVLRYEDRHFYSHPGVNPFSLFRAALSMLGGGRRMGGSTITMQVVRLSHNLETGKPGAKLRQMLLALQLEWHFSKDEILEAYFNLAPYGGNIEGLGAAALVYFHKTPAQLTQAESAALMLVPQNPVKRRPSQDNPVFAAAVKRLDQAWSGRTEHAPLRIYGPQDLPFEAPHICAELLERHRDGGVLRTTLSPTLQKRVEGGLRAFASRNAAYGLKNAAALVVHWPSMEIRALAGSADFHDARISGEIDGTRARRSPGSTLKPLIYALALDQGIIHPHTLLLDTPRSFAGYDPENFDGSFRGPVSAAEALRSSRNVPALTLAARLKHPGLYEFLRRADVEFLSGEEHYGLSLVLGGAELNMRELASLYAMLANKGVWRPLRLLGNEREETARPLLSPEAAFVTLSMLEDGSTDHRVRSRGGAVLPLRFKTGTSNGFRDAWTVGIVGPYVLALWIGNFDNSSNPLLVGGQVAAPLFVDMAREIAAAEALKDTLGQPAPGLNLQRVSVCAATGDLDTSLCPDTTETWYIPGVSPLKDSGVFRTILVDTQTGLRACTPRKGRTETRVWEFWPSNLTQMFARAGIRKPPPPPFGPECLEAGQSAGQPPTIAQPKEGLIYRIRLSPEGNQPLAFVAHADAGVRELYWFLDGSYLGSSRPGQALLWTARPGDAVVRVVDDAGRSAQRRLKIRATP